MDYESVARPSKDTQQASTELTRNEARYLVYTYYQMQEYRIATAAQGRKLAEAGEPNAFISHFQREFARLESQIKKALGIFADSDPVGKWSLGICGIGPVIAAGLLAHIDIEKAGTAGHIWSFAGLEPNQAWEKGKKRPWNGDLKKLCWHIGESLVKVSNREQDAYGDLYRERKKYEQDRNEAGDYAEQAARKLAETRIGKETEAYGLYSAGKLPPGHIQARVKRWLVKLFLAHWHHVAYVARYGKEPPKPYPIAILQHADYIGPPGFAPGKAEGPPADGEGLQ